MRNLRLLPPMDNVLSVSRSRWRLVADSDPASRVFDGFNLASSVPIVPTHVNAATKPARVNAASSMASKTAVWMAFEKNAKKASSVALTNARPRLPPATQTRLFPVRTHDPYQQRPLIRASVASHE